MRYQRLLDLMVRTTELNEDSIRRVMEALPPALMELRHGEKVVTPLGSFTGKFRKGGPKRLPDGSEIVSPSEFKVAMRPGKSLRQRSD